MKLVQSKKLLPFFQPQIKFKKFETEIYLEYVGQNQIRFFLPIFYSYDYFENILI